MADMDNDTESKADAVAWAPSLPLAAVAALIGGLIGFAIVQPLDPIIAHADIPELSLSPSDEEIEEFIQAKVDFYGGNYAVDLAIIGACIGLVFTGLTVPRMKVPSAILSAILGALGGGAMAYYAGQTTGIELAFSKDQYLTTAAMLNFGIWGGMGVGIALGAGPFQGGAAATVKAVLAAVIAAILLVVVYVLVASIVFSGANLINFVPVSFTERLVWIVVSSLTFGAAMSVGLKPAEPKNKVADAASSQEDYDAAAGD